MVITINSLPDGKLRTVRDGQVRTSLLFADRSRQVIAISEVLPLLSRLVLMLNQRMLVISVALRLTRVAVIGSV